MSAGTNLLFSLLHHTQASERLTGFNLARRRGVKVESFMGPSERDTFEFISAYVARYGSVPSRELVEHETRIVFPAHVPEEPLAFWIDEVQELSLTVLMHQEASKIVSVAERGSTEDAVSILMDLADTVRQRQAIQTVRPLGALFEEVLDQHDALQAGEISLGIPTGIPYIDQVSGGIQPGDVWAVLGSSGAGKSYLMCRMAMSACDLGYRVLFVPMEMSLSQIARRNAALGAAVNHTAFRMGYLSAFAMQKLRGYVEHWHSRGEPDRFMIMEGLVDLSVSDIHARISEYKPDVVFVDGAYMVRGTRTRKGAQKWESVMEAQEEIRRIALADDVAFVNSYQFAKEGESKGQEGVGYSYAIVQLASVVLGLKSVEGPTAYMETEYSQIFYKILELLKGREGEKGKLKLRYDMRLTQIEQAEILESSVTIDLTSSGLADRRIEADPEFVPPDDEAEDDDTVPF